MKFLRFCALFLALSTIIPSQVDAQCPMCRMSAESDLKNGGTAGKGLNTGIMYMLSFPYILLGTIGFIWYRNRRQVAAYEQREDLLSLLEPHPLDIELDKN